MTMINIVPINMGCDPEIFLARDGKTIGAEKVLPKGGLPVSGGKIIIDGVQAEINPAPSTCRESLAGNIRSCLMNLESTCKKHSSDTQVNFDRTAQVMEEEFASLSEEAKRFGCAPSTNFWSKAESVIPVDPTVYRTRSAGGHIHLGFSGNGSKPAINNIEAMVPMLDILVGNTCVLIDRDPGNIERRKVYGRAGEYRKPDDGRIEYRTLSNFWLRSYQTMSMVFGFARTAVSIVAAKQYEAIFNAVSMENVQKAINENDFDLAWKNFLAIEDLVYDMMGDNNSRSLCCKNKSAFRFFVQTVKEFGLNFFFSVDPITHWKGMNTSGAGWESFITIAIPIVMKQQELLQQRNEQREFEQAQVLSLVS